jgi:hypothetical protein
MGPLSGKPWVRRSVRWLGRIASRGVAVALAVLAALGDKNVGPVLSPHERPPVSREEYRP